MNVISYHVKCKKGTEEKVDTGIPVVFNTDLGMIPDCEKLLPPSLAARYVSVTPPGPIFLPTLGAFPEKSHLPLPTIPNSEPENMGSCPWNATAGRTVHILP